jgi:hypothetical protein
MLDLDQRPVPSPLGDYRGMVFSGGSKKKVKGVIQDYTPCNAG